ncbi:MAG: dockerin type I domain-containing protein [Pirellulales bacterium]
MIRHARCIAALLLIGLTAGVAAAQDLNAVRDDQINRLKNYVLAAIRPNGLVRDSVVLNNPGGSFHPATPDAAGFALLSLAAFDHLGKMNDAASRVENILRAYAGQNAGVTPDRSADGHFVHFMNVSNGAYATGWDHSYTPIGTALLVAGAQFAANHFADNANIRALSDQLTQSVNFNAAIHPNLNGRIFLDMGKAGGGVGGTVTNWNEFMLVESLALREENNDRALAIKHRWLDTDFIPKRSYAGTPTLTDSASSFASGFWVQQMHFFNGDFRHSADFEQFFLNQRDADKAYSAQALGEDFRYGLTAGLVPSPEVYHADRIFDHPHNVFSPEAVAGWGDMETLLQFYNQQIPTSNAAYQLGMVRVSAEQPNWKPADAGLVDHLFLLFGLVESLDPNFFADRMFPALAAGDYNADGSVDLADYELWKSKFGSTTHLAADGNGNGRIDAGDYAIWRDNYAGVAPAALVPEPAAALLMAHGALVALIVRRRLKWFNNKGLSAEAA